MFNANNGKKHRDHFLIWTLSNKNINILQAFNHFFFFLQEISIISCSEIPICYRPFFEEFDKCYEVLNKTIKFGKVTSVLA